MLRRVAAIVRILLGLGFLWLGASKITDATFLYGGLLETLERFGRPYAFYQRMMIARFVEMHQELFARAVLLGAIVVGVCLVSGALVSLASVAAAGLLLNFALATAAGHPFYLALEIAAILAFLALGRLGAGLTWGLDAWLTQYVNPAVILFPLRFSLPES